MVLLITMSLYNTLGSLGASHPPFTITEATLTQSGTGEAYLQVQVANTGGEPIRMTGTFENLFVPPLNFRPSLVPSGETTTGTASSTAQVSKFDGSSTFIQTPDSIALNPRELSVEVVFSPSNHFPDQEMIIGKGQAGQNSLYFYSFRSAGNINDFVVYENNTRYDHQLGDIFVPGEWYDVVFTLDGHNVTAYVNGEIKTSWSRNVLFLGNLQDLFVGACPCGGYYFDGRLASVRLYDRALTPSEVSNNHFDATPATNGLSLWYQLNRTSSASVQDLSGNQNNGVVAGVMSFQPPLAKGQYYVVTVTSTADNGQKYSIDIAVPLV